jgi:hypothetical protein
VGEKAALTPLGNPVAFSVMAELKPARLVTVTVLVPLLPWVTVSVAGESERVNVEGGGYEPLILQAPEPLVEET